MTVFQNKPSRKPTRRQILRRMGLIALDSVLYYLPRLGFIILCLLALTLDVVLALAAMMAMFMAVALIWSPWPAGVLFQVPTVIGLLLWALGPLHLIYKFYRHAARQERAHLNQEYIK